MSQPSIEQEAEAIKTLSGVLENLSPSARNAVIDYVFKRLNITVPGAAAAPVEAAPAMVTGKKRGRKPGTKLTSGKKLGRPAKLKAGGVGRRGRPKKNAALPPDVQASPAPAEPMMPQA